MALHFLPLPCADIIQFPAHAIDDTPRNLMECVTTDGEVYELYRCPDGEQYLRYTMDGNDAVPAQVIPLPADVLRALAKVGGLAVEGCVQ